MEYHAYGGPYSSCMAEIIFSKNPELKEIAFFQKIPVWILLSPFVALYCGLREHLIPSRYDNNHINDSPLCVDVYVLAYKTLKFFHKSSTVFGLCDVWGL